MRVRDGPAPGQDLRVCRGRFRDCSERAHIEDRESRPARGEPSNSGGPPVRQGQCPGCCELRRSWDRASGPAQNGFWPLHSPLDRPITLPEKYVPEGGPAKVPAFARSGPSPRASVLPPVVLWRFDSGREKNSGTPRQRFDRSREACRRCPSIPILSRRKERPEAGTTATVRRGASRPESAAAKRETVHLHLLPSERPEPAACLSRGFSR